MKHIKHIKKLVIVLLSLLIALFCVGVLYTSIYYHAEDSETVRNALESDEQVEVFKSNKDIIFKPLMGETKTGIIFYPGAKVEETAYAPLFKSLSKEGFFGAVIHMPVRLAVLDINAADRIIEQYPEIDKWYIMGHSLGGAMAANYTKNNADHLNGLILLGAYSADDLSDTPLPVLSIHGSKDMVLNQEKFKESKAYMPDGYKEISIEGGNHANYGYYGEQKGDGTATISREEQQKIVVEEINEFIGEHYE